MRRQKLLTFIATSALAWMSLGGACRVSSPQGRPEEKCVADCTKRASAYCSEQQCIRGCRFVLDRLLEREGEAIVGCVARGKRVGEFATSNSLDGRTCNDNMWASCAVQVGEYADGGPPAPGHYYDDDEE